VSQVRVRRLAHNPDLPLPSRRTSGSAGFDLASAEPDFVLAPGERRLVATGLAVELPAGVEGQVRPRSGLALRHGLTMPNAPGTIDSDYRGELKVILQNGGTDPVTIARGDRIAQLVVVALPTVSPTWVAELPASQRGEGGFGSTGSS
jgi:dUTP pyrophosphatase